MAISGVTHEIVSSAYGSRWLSKNDAVVEPQVYAKRFQQYGGGMRILSFLEAAERVVNLPANPTITTVEETSPIPAIKTGAEVAVTAAGGDITLQLHADVFDTNNLHPVRLYETILIPAQYMATDIYNDRLYRVESMATTTLANDTLTCTPLDDDSDIDTAIPSGTWLMLGYTPYSVGTGQPAGRTDDYTTRTHAKFLLKHTLSIEGAVASTKFYEAAGIKYFFDERLMRAEFEFDVQKDIAITTGEANENTLVMTSVADAGTPAVLSGKGIVTWANELAQDYKYTDEIDLDAFEQFKILFDSRGVGATTARMLTGPDLRRQLDSAGLDWIREFSGGTDLKVGTKLGITLEGFVRSGITYNVLDVKSFANPATFGIQNSDVYAYAFPTMGLVIPDENVTYSDFAGSKGLTLPNVVLGYVNYGGENRGNILKRHLGTNNANDGIDTATEYDLTKYYLLSHFGLVVGGVQKWIIVRKRKAE
jgi:hypothetical protein